MESYFPVLEAIAAAPCDGVLAIIIEVEGSAYQKERCPQSFLGNKRSLPCLL
ncbi:hypothetical protein [Geobacillus sp. FJAT-46040]|uniref:hypothetical protein n=1 Tax=Geobacillus TaxID=129337 RepID=UPI001304696C|nr:hypothetical protein [Geobacillus sp. FJAT-46040]